MTWAKSCGNKDCKTPVLVDFISIHNLERNGHQNSLATDIVFCSVDCFFKFTDDLKIRVKNGSAEKEPKFGDRQVLLCAKTGEMTMMTYEGCFEDFGSGHLGWMCLHGNAWGHVQK